MAEHIHSVFDKDIPCEIDPTSRAISIPSGKTLLVQGDHNSEQYTFVIPKVIESHAMINCNQVRVIFSNVGAKAGELSEGVYEITDLAVRGTDTNLTCTWNVEKPATMYAGKLHFALEFRCLDDEGNITYEWNTDTNKELTVLSKNDPVAAVIEKYPDSLARFEEFLAAGGSITVDEDLSATSENPVQNKAISKKFSQVETAILTTTNTAIDARNIAKQAKDAVDDVIDLTNDFNDDIGTLLNDVGTLKNNVDGLQDSVDDAMSELRRLNEGVDGITDRVDSIDTRVIALEQNGTGVGGKLDVHEVEGYAFAVGDEEGNIALGIKEDGETVGTFTDKVARDKLAPITSTKDYAYAVCDDYGRVVFGITHDGEVKYIGKGEGGESGGGSTFDYTKCGLPVLYLEGDTSGMSKDKEDAKELTYTLGANTGTCKVRWQGSSSVSRGYPKRNYTIDFDNPFEATEVWGQDNERVVNFAKPWGAQKKYCAKANWIDPSGARNVVCARLWAAIVADRAERYGTVPEKLLTAPNNGAIDGFPIIIVINGEFTGLYTFNIPKDDWTFNMGDGAAEYVVACESNSTEYASCRWSGPATFEDEEDYAIEVIPDGVEDSVLIGSFNDAIDAMVNATQSSQWETDVAPYFDVDAAIDYMIFVCCIGGRDNLRKNVLYGTYDGIKWFMSAYDLDTTFGANVHNKGWYKVINDRNQFYEASTMHRVFSYIYKFSKERLKARYAELRSTVLSDENVWYMLNNFVSDIPLVVYNMDAERWSDKLDSAPGRKTAMNGTATANVNNYMHYYRMHCAYLDKEIDAL